MGYLWNFNVMVWRLSAIVAGLSLPLVANALDKVFVEVANVQVSDLRAHRDKLSKVKG